MKSFSQALTWECKGTGVTVQTLCPGFVDTNIIASNASLMPAMFFPKPEAFVKKAADTIGKVSTTAGCLPHDIQVKYTKIFYYCHNFLFMRS
jgi:short-subunit dehydrogenase